MTIRQYNPKDCSKIIKMFYDTVHSVNSVDYSELQINAWAPNDMDLSEWDKRLSNGYSIVVEKDDVIVGFGNADDTGHLDCLYTHKDYQGIGVATLIVNEIENYIFNKGIEVVYTEASITAKPFFEKRGYVVLEKQTVECRGQFLTNFKMQKRLS